MSFLEEILPEIRRAVADPEYFAGLADAPPRAPPSLRDAVVAARGWAVLIEWKRRSPGASPPELKHRPVAEFVRLVEQGGASALSCLATGPRFLGSPRDVADLAETSRLPVLFKDLVVDPKQVEAARRSGASAILLVARLETERSPTVPLRALAERARAAGLEVVLELHGPEDLKVAERVPADVYGINLRDLESLTFRPEVAHATAEAARRLRPLLGLSGVGGAEDARRWASWGVDGILVGTGFARATDPSTFLHEIRAARPTDEGRA
ncbi:MAG: indole-3-glycerol phosphate synthase TrpC [Thermoplasmata archaeon]